MNEYTKKVAAHYNQRVAGSSRTGAAHRELGFLRALLVSFQSPLLLLTDFHITVMNEYPKKVAAHYKWWRVVVAGQEELTGNWASAWETIHSGCREARGATSSCCLVQPSAI